MAEVARGWDREGGRPGPSAAAAAALRPGAQGGRRAGGVCARAGAASESVQSWGGGGRWGRGAGTRFSWFSWAGTLPLPVSLGEI